MTEFSITPVTPDQFDEAFDLVTEVFAQSSSLHAALDVALAPYRQGLRPSFKAMVSRNLSLAARTTDGRMLGCLIATDMYATLSDAPPSGPYPEIAALTRSLTQTYHKQHALGPGEVLLVDMAATHPDARGLGTYQAMREHIQPIARAAGFRAIVGELSSAATQHVVLTKMGHRKVAETHFQGFEWNGTRPFQSITSPPSIILAEGRL
ncbi:MAG: hypothetical protein AAF641_00355 [Pseudomonadota bacterium]